MDFNNIVDNLKAVKVSTPTEQIIIQLKQLIVSGQLKAGDRLPPERVLSERFGVGRGHIREAIMKLEFYGILRTSPQSGTYVSSLSIKVLDNVFSDLIRLSKDDYASLIEGRYYLERIAVKLAAERRTDDDIAEMQAAQRDFELKANVGQVAIDEDMLFHMNIARSSKNAVIELMMLTLLPDLIANIFEKEICKLRSAATVTQEHHDILNAIIEQDPEKAEKAMKYHLHDIMQSRRSFQ